MAQNLSGLHLPKFQGGNKNTFLVKRQLLNVIRQVIERLDNLDDTYALYAEVQRAFVFNIINQNEFTELTSKLDAVLDELKKENET